MFFHRSNAPFNPSDKLIFVNINNSYNAMIDKNTADFYYRPNLYECTRKYWKVDVKKAQVATHILGCYKGKVVEVISIEKFHIEEMQEPGGKKVLRKVFEGKEEKKSKYLGLDLHDIFSTLANFHTKYWNI